MKAYLFLVILCYAIAEISEASIESDLDFELFKHLDVLPLNHDHDVDFDEPYEPYDSTYDGGGDSENDDDSENDIEDGKTEVAEESTTKNPEENTTTQPANEASTNSADYADDAESDEDDDDGDEEGEEKQAKDDATTDDTEEDDEDAEEEPEESKLESSTIKAVDPEAKETVDPQSFAYVSPEDVKYRLSREKRSKKTDNDYDFSKSYREFVREHFGDEEAKTLSDDREKPKQKKSDEGEAVEEDEDYEEGAGDGDGEEYDDDEEEDGGEEEADDDDDDGGGAVDAENDPEYQNVKKMSAQNDDDPKYCKIVYKDNQECRVCKNPHTHDTSENCSYSSSPAPKRYAFKREKNYNSHDDEGDADEDEVQTKKPKKAKKQHKTQDYDDEYVTQRHPKKPKSKKKSKKSQKGSGKKNPKRDVYQSLYNNYQAPHWYYDRERNTNTPLHNHYIQNDDDDLSYRASEPFAVTASSEEYEKEVDYFKGRDWSQCKRKIKNELTCYYCKDTDGATQEECMFISGNDDSFPKPKKTDKVVTTSSKSKRFATTSKPSTTTTSFFDINPSQERNIPGKPKRLLNRSQNFYMSPIPIARSNYSPVTSDNRRSLDFTNMDPIKTLEYKEPTNRKTLKRMVKLRIFNQTDKPIIDDATVFYSKVFKKF